MIARVIRFVRERAGVVRIRLRATQKGRRYLRRHPMARLRVDVTARDAAGNVTTTRPKRKRRG